jgi:signal transduction histidine kinase
MIPSEIDSSPARIIIVDDVASARQMLGSLLYREGYALQYIKSGVELLEKLDELNPDVILLDVMMPGMDGFEVCRRIRARAEWQHLPIILVTALDSQEDIVAGLGAGADDFVHKPVAGLELRARVRSMLRIKKQFDALQAALKLREDLVHMIVHDMRTPLTAIIGFTELLRGGFITSEDTADINKLHRQALRLNAFVNDILVQAKTEHNQLVLNLSEVDIHRLINTVAEDHSLIAQTRKIGLQVELPVETRLVSIDAGLFQRVVDNLLTNAIKFSPPHSIVTLRVEYPAQSSCQLRVSVWDQGPGVAHDDRQRIFYKYEIAGMKNMGDIPIGLGLSFARLVVEAHGGQIWVEENQPTGSIFVIEL